MTNSERTVARLDRMMRRAVLALMATEAGLAPDRPVYRAPRAWRWPRADDYREMVRFPDEE